MRWELLRILSGARSKRNSEIAAKEQASASKETEETASGEPRSPSGLEKLNIKGPLDASNVEAVEAELHRLAAEQAGHSPDSPQVKGDRGHRPLMLPQAGDRDTAPAAKEKTAPSRGLSSPRGKPRFPQSQSRGSSQSQQSPVAAVTDAGETENPPDELAASSSSPNAIDSDAQEPHLQDRTDDDGGLASAAKQDRTVSESAAKQPPSQDATTSERQPDKAEISQPAEAVQSPRSDPVATSSEQEQDSSENDPVVMTPEQEQDSSENDPSAEQEHESSSTAPVVQETSLPDQSPPSNQPLIEVSKLPLAPKKKNPTLIKKKAKSASQPSAAPSSPLPSRVDGDFTPEQLFQLLMMGSVPKNLGSKKNSRSAMQCKLCKCSCSC